MKKKRIKRNGKAAVIITAVKILINKNSAKRTS